MGRYFGSPVVVCRPSVNWQELPEPQESAMLESINLTSVRMAP